VICGLQQAHARYPPVFASLQHRTHECPAYSMVLRVRSDGDVTYPGDRERSSRKLVPTIPPVALGDHAEETGCAINPDINQFAASIDRTSGGNPCWEAIEAKASVTDTARPAHRLGSPDVLSIPRRLSVLLYVHPMPIACQSRRR